MPDYGVIVADPPWAYNNSACKGCAADQYLTMPDAAICQLPIADMAADNSILLLWATWPKLDIAFSVISAWGFTYKTGLPWVKLIGEPFTDLWGMQCLKPSYGVGFWFRGCSEPLLLCTRGKPVRLRDADYVGILSENFQHSRKPDNVYEIAECYEGPYMELFARRKRNGWHSWGNEVASDIRVSACLT